MPPTTLPAAVDGRGAFDVAEQAVRRAGAIIATHLPQMSRPVDERTVTVTAKEGWNNLVTDVDDAAEAAALAVINTAFPDDAILAEESGSHDGTTGFTWCIDPLDGTRNFASGIPHLCVNLALGQGNRIVLGMTYDPVRDELFHAIEGGGAFLNGQRIAVSEQTTLQEAVLGTDMSYKAREGKLLLNMLSDLWPGIQAIRMMDSSALGLAYVAAGRLEIYVHHYLQPWDMTPGILLVREAGGTATDLRGNPAQSHSGCIIAGAPNVHARFIEATDSTAWRASQP